jgi:hypothetical protein
VTARCAWCGLPVVTSGERWGSFGIYHPACWDTAPPCRLCEEAIHFGTRCRARILEGRRNDSLFRLGVRLTRWGGRWFDRDCVEEYLLAENESRCEPHLSENEVHQIAESVARSVRPHLRREAIGVEA